MPLDVRQFGVGFAGADDDLTLESIEAVQFLFELVFEWNHHDRFAEHGRLGNTFESAGGNQSPALDQLFDVTSQIRSVHFKVGWDRGRTVGTEAADRLIGMPLAVADELGQMRAIVQVGKQVAAGLGCVASNTFWRKIGAVTKRLPCDSAG